MKLNETLYTIISRNDELKSFTIELIANCTIYRAHFPEQPITPGVCIIQIASELLSQLLDQDIELRSISNAKFLSVINPLETPRVTFVFKKIEEVDDTAAIKISTVVMNDAVTYAKLSLVLSKK